METEGQTTNGWSCARCGSKLALVDYCDDGLTLVCSHCGYATSPTIVCPRCGYATNAEECLQTRHAHHRGSGVEEHRTPT